jgi:hypothetical protein
MNRRMNGAPTASGPQATLLRRLVDALELARQGWNGVRGVRQEMAGH